MNNRDSAVALVKLLTDYPDGLSKNVITRKLHISSVSSFYRVLRNARLLGTVRIETGNGLYKIINADMIDDPVETILPTDDELIALLTMQRIVAAMTSPFLNDAFRPLGKKCDAILKLKVRDPHQWADRIKILDIHYRCITEGTFGALVNALARKYAVRFLYTNAEGSTKERTVSPQHLVRYRDNWYLDAFCHEKQALRTFSLDLIENIKHVNEPWYGQNEDTCREILATSYGIFSGTPKAAARIRLCGKAARYAQREVWHPHQKIVHVNDATIEIEIPYSQPHELIREILSWGDDAEVVSPEELRNEIMERIRKMGLNYKFDN
jgi:predicted DNA-binding transcriptional regulator YafY